MIFGVHEASVIKDFWFTEIMLGTVYVSVVMVIAIYTAITHFLKKKIKFLVKLLRSQYSKVKADS